MKVTWWKHFNWIKLWRLLCFSKKRYGFMENASSLKVNALIASEEKRSSKSFIHHKPDSSIFMALALASSSAVTHLCRSTSLEARRWKTWVPPFEMTKLQASNVSIKAPAKFIVPRHVWAISAWLLRDNQTDCEQHHQTRRWTQKHRVVSHVELQEEFYL